MSKCALRKDIRTYIQEQIASGRYKAGDRVVETQLVKELNVSQASAREAILELAALEALLHEMDASKDIHEFVEKNMAPHALIAEAADSPALRARGRVCGW